MSGTVLLAASVGPSRDDCVALGKHLSAALDSEVVIGSATGSARRLLEDVRRIAPDLVITGSASTAASGVVEVAPEASALIDQASTAVAIAPQGYAKRWDGRWLRIGAGFAAEDGSSAAVAAGSRVARKSGAELVVLTVADSTTWGFRAAGCQGATEYLRQKDGQARETLRIGLSEVPDVVSSAMRLQRGDAAAELRAAAEHLDLLVVGAAGHTHLPGIAPIGDLDAALRGMPAPVLVVPQSPESTPQDAVPVKAADRSTVVAR